MAVLLHDGQGVVQVSRTVAKVNCSETRRMDGSSVVRQIHLMVTVLSHFKLTQIEESCIGFAPSLSWRPSTLSTPASRSPHSVPYSERVLSPEGCSAPITLVPRPW